MKTVADYRAFAYVFDDLAYEFDSAAIERRRAEVGEEGVVTVGAPSRSAAENSERSDPVGGRVIVRTAIGPAVGPPRLREAHLDTRVGDVRSLLSGQASRRCRRPPQTDRAPSGIGGDRRRRGCRK